MRGPFILVGILLLLFVLSVSPFSETRQAQRTCITAPDASHTVVYNGTIFRRVRTDTPIFSREIAAYLQSTQPADLYINDVFRPSYISIFDGIGENNAPNWTPPDGVEKLLFVDTTLARQQADPGYTYFDIYLKPNASSQYVLPAFIEVFCRQHFPIDRKTLYPDKDGNFSPPPIINTDSIIWKTGQGAEFLKPSPTTDYYIFAYESEKSLSWNFTTQSSWTTGTLKNYTIYYVFGSVIQYIGLLDKDTIYRYAARSKDFQPAYPQANAPTASVNRGNLQLETFDYPGINAVGWWNPE